MKIIKKSINIGKPMCFLCGPYFEEKVYDRRKILRNFLISKHEVIPIIVDNFLDRRYINDDSINIDLLEELCAAVSYKTYIFLDTFSSVAELGMFCSQTYQNKIDVFIPKNTDIISNNIGVFIRAIIQNSNNNKIECLSYRPKIVRVPLASDYVTEYYEFTKDELPQNIKNRITQDDVFTNSSFNLVFIADSGNGSEENGVIIYNHTNSRITFTISLRMLFYLVASIVLEGEKVENNVVMKLKALLKDSYCFYENKDKSDILEVIVKTQLIHDIHNIIKHILTFINLYHTNGDPKGRQIITKKTSFIDDIGSFLFFGITPLHEYTINEYLKSPDSFVEIIKIKRGKNTRNVTKYKNDENGINLRDLHRVILNMLQNIHCYSDNSYAYRKGYSILDCVLPHKRSISFLKIDIIKFFNSIRYVGLYNSSKGILKKFFAIDSNFRNLLKACMYNNMLPLGLITSPIMSDIYLNEFDSKVSNFLKAHDKNITFTRYADDMFFSCEAEMNDNDINYIIGSLAEELGKISLQINHEKVKTKTLNNVGDHVKLLGLNIIKTKEQNEITVGKKYINDTCKMLFQCLNDINREDVSSESKFYTEKRILGRVAYIKQIEGRNGYSKLLKRINKSKEHRANNMEIIDLRRLIEIETESAE